MRRRRDLRLCGLALFLTIGFAALHLVAPDLPGLRHLELYALDLRLRLRTPEPIASDIVIVSIDDRTITELGRWPVPRQALAEVVRILHRAGAKAIGLDLLFAEPERAQELVAQAGDAALAEAMREARNVVLPFTFRFGEGTPRSTVPDHVARAAYARLRNAGGYDPLALAPTGLVLPLAQLAEPAILGQIFVAYDVDGAARYDYPALAYDLDYYPSMAIRLAQLYLGVPWSEVGLELGRGIRIGPVLVPTDRQMRLLVNYPAPPGHFTTYSLSRVLSGELPAASFGGRVVLVGANALGTGDTFETPFTSALPGVERLAAVVNSIVSGRHLRRSDAAPWLEVSAMIVTALALGLAASRLSVAAALAVAFAVIAVPAVSGQIVLERYGVWQASAVPILAAALTFTALVLYRYGLLDKEHRHIRRVFNRYLPSAMVDRLTDTAKLPELGGELRRLTILFCDLRGFTGLSERIEPALLTRLANAFLSAASEAIHDEGGTVDKFMGDAIMAFWNAPIEQPDHAIRACRAALGIIAKLEATNQALAAQGIAPRLAVGIGINTGACVVGNFGSTRRLDYSAIGDAVNVAARLEAETRSCGWTVLLGPETAAAADDFAVVPLGVVELRGRAAATAVFAMLGDHVLAGMPDFAAFRRAWCAGDEVRARKALAALDGKAAELGAFHDPSPLRYPRAC